MSLNKNFQEGMKNLYTKPNRQLFLFHTFFLLDVSVCGCNYNNSASTQL
jgi:hypothetical protein